MRLSIGPALLAGAFLLNSGGCQKLSNAVIVDESVDVASKATKAKIIDGLPKDQKISVSAQSTTAEFSIYVLLEKDRMAFEDRLTNLQPPTGNLLAKQEKTKEAALVATIPAKQEYAIVVSNDGAKPVQVKLKVTNLP